MYANSKNTLYKKVLQGLNSELLVEKVKIEDVSELQLQ